MGEGPLVAAEPRLQEALLLAIDRAAEPYDAIFLEGLPVGSVLWDVIRSSPAIRDRFRVWMPVGITRRHRLELPATLDDYLAQLSAKRRKGLRYTKRRLEAKGAVTVERVTRQEELPRFFRMVESVSTRTWQARRLGQVFSTTSPQAERLERSAQRGWLRSYLLLCGDAPIAFALGLQADAVFRYEVVGFDPAWSEYSPGNVLLHGIVEDLIAFDRPKVLDFGHGEAEYKQQFGNRTHPEANVYLVRRKRAATLAYLTAAACARANRAAKGVLGTLDLVRAARHRLRAADASARGDAAAGPAKKEP
jgi:CelD/BcsL family acetyltransferase involved in cellulose biosynthesis